MLRFGAATIAFLAITLSPMHAETSMCMVDLSDYTGTADVWASGGASGELMAYGFGDRLSVFRKFHAMLHSQRRGIANGVGSKIADFAGFCARHVDRPLAAGVRRVNQDFNAFTRDFAREKRTPGLASRAQRHLRDVTRRIAALRATRVYLTGGINDPVDSLAHFVADFARALRNASQGRSVFAGIPAAVAASPALERIPWGLGNVGAPVANFDDPPPEGFVASLRTFSFPDAADTESHLPYLRNYEGTYTYTLGKTARFRTPWLSYRDRSLTCSPDCDEFRMPWIYAYDSGKGSYRVVRILTPGDTVDLTPYFP